MAKVLRAGRSLASAMIQKASLTRSVPGAKLLPPAESVGHVTDNMRWLAEDRIGELDTKSRLMTGVQEGVCVQR
jgi:hypothetical protein